MKTILIVDDNESICNILYHYGKEAGCGNNNGAGTPTRTPQPPR